jgi:hypothetical protein
VKGAVYVHRSQRDYARDIGFEPEGCEDYAGGDDLLIAFSRSEFQRIPQGVPVVFVEHGAGANYNGGSHIVALHRSYMPPVAAVLTTPAQEAIHRRAFGKRVHAVGCPKQDEWAGYKHKRTQPPVVAFSHHWNQKEHPETRSAWPWDAEAWEDVITSGRYQVIGHKHPGDTRDVEGWCSQRGVEFVARFNEVMRRADVFVADNSSTLYEFAATGRPVVVLSPPWYGRDVDHGTRFWANVPGVECAIAEHLGACIAEALADVPARKALRARAVEAVYGPMDGRAAERSAQIIASLEGVKAADLPVVRNMGPTPKGRLRYPVTLAVDCQLGGKRYPKGARVHRDVAVALKAAGQLTDPRIV